MSITAKDVLTRVSTILFDEGATRWPLVELANWLNDALKEISLHAPNAVSKTVVLTMVEGTQQTLPDAYLSLLRVNANVVANEQTVTERKSIIRPIARAALDHQISSWQDNNVLPFTTLVTHIVDDYADSRKFLVAPGNDGNGKIEALVAARPAEVPTPSNPLDIEGYDTDLDIDPIYLSALVDFVLSKALAKDTNVANGGNRAVAHYTQFANALGIKAQADMTSNPNAGTNT